MTWPDNSWIFTKKKLKGMSTQNFYINIYRSIIIKPQTGNNSNIHQLMNG